MKRERRTCDTNSAATLVLRLLGLVLVLLVLANIVTPWLGKSQAPELWGTVRDIVLAMVALLAKTNVDPHTQSVEVVNKPDAPVPTTTEEKP